jgi:Uma2 family endonuclease
MLLTGSLRPVIERLHPDGNYLIAGDTGIYWRVTDEPLQGCKVPDWYYVPGVPRVLDGTYRRSYVMWQEHVHPLVLMEYVSGDGSEELDTTPETGKFWVYEHVIQPRYYVIHDPDRERLQVFELVDEEFRRMPATAEGRYRIAPLGVDLGIWKGEYQNCPAAWLRAWDWNGRLIPTLEEAAEQERNRAEQERNRAEQERNRAEKLEARLRELGIDPGEV